MGVGVNVNYFGHSFILNSENATTIKTNYFNYSVPLILSAAPTGWSNTIDGVAAAAIAKIKVITIASIVKVNGVE